MPDRHYQASNGSPTPSSGTRELSGRTAMSASAGSEGAPDNKILVQSSVIPASPSETERTAKGADSDREAEAALEDADEFAEDEEEVECPAEDKAPAPTPTPTPTPTPAPTPVPTAAAAGGELVLRKPVPGRVSVGVQAAPVPRYRLRFLPLCGCAHLSDWRYFCQLGRCARMLGRWALSQCGLGSLLLAWALVGAAAFHAAEGPREAQQARQIRHSQQELSVELAAELKRQTLLQPACCPEPGWSRAVDAYVRKHEALLLSTVAEGYGEGGGGDIWSYAGCLLFAVSLLTTLGFGAPVPRTTWGRIAAVVFAALGIPLHLLLVLNIGTLAAARLQRLATRRRARGRRPPPHSSPAARAPAPGFACPGGCLLPCCCRRGKKASCSQQDVHPSEDGGPGPGPAGAVAAGAGPAGRASPRWLQWLPVPGIVTYYLLGVVAFGAARGRPFAACLLFPLDFTAAGGVGLTPGPVRALYAAYLEGAVVLAATCVAILQVAASRGLTNLGLKLGLLTNS